MIEKICGYKDTTGKFHDTKEKAISASLAEYILKATEQAWCEKYYPGENLVIHINISPREVAEYVSSNIEQIYSTFNSLNDE